MLQLCADCRVFLSAVSLDQVLFPTELLRRTDTRRLYRNRYISNPKQHRTTNPPFITGRDVVSIASCVTRTAISHRKHECMTINHPLSSPRPPIAPSRISK